VRSLIHDNLAFRPFVAKTASMAAFKRICARHVGHEFNRSRFALLELPTVLWRSENQAGRAHRLGAIGNRCNFETVIVVGGCDLELNFGAGPASGRRVTTVHSTSFYLSPSILVPLVMAIGMTNS
jgi:hypothetical protein